MIKLFEYVYKNKYRLLIITILAFWIPIIAVHTLFKIELDKDSWFVAKWNAGELLTYIAGFETLIGTVFLGLISLHSTEQSQKIANQLSKENNQLQKILAQNMFPIVNIRNVHVSNTDNMAIVPQSLSGKTGSYVVGISESVNNCYINILVNVDAVADAKKVYKKSMEFEFENVSQVLIRHIAFNQIIINGFEGVYDNISCYNIDGRESGKSIALSPFQRISVRTDLYFCNSQLISVWEDNRGGIPETFIITNTSITGERFGQYICVRAYNDGKANISFGDWNNRI